MVLCSNAGGPSGEVALHSEMLSYWLAVWKNAVLLSLCVRVCVCAIEHLSQLHYTAHM